MSGNAVIRFKVGETYQVRSLGDWDCIFSFTVVSRTAKFVTLQHGSAEKTLRVGVKVNRASCGECLVETAKPFGRYSLAPTIWADRTTV